MPMNWRARHCPSRPKSCRSAIGASAHRTQSARIGIATRHGRFPHRPSASSTLRAPCGRRMRKSQPEAKPVGDAAPTDDARLAELLAHHEISPGARYEIKLYIDWYLSDAL